MWDASWRSGSCWWGDLWCFGEYGVKERCVFAMNKKIGGEFRYFVIFTPTCGDDDLILLMFPIFFIFLEWAGTTTGSLTLPSKKKIQRITLPQTNLVGGFKHFLCSPLFGEMIQFDDHIFQMGWNHQLVIVCTWNTWGRPTALMTWAKYHPSVGTYDVLLTTHWDWHGYGLIYHKVKANVGKLYLTWIVCVFHGFPDLCCWWIWNFILYFIFVWGEFERSQSSDPSKKPGEFLELRFQSRREMHMAKIDRFEVPKRKYT